MNAAFIAISFLVCQLFLIVKSPIKCGKNHAVLHRHISYRRNISSSLCPKGTNMLGIRTVSCLDPTIPLLLLSINFYQFLVHGHGQGEQIHSSSLLSRPEMMSGGGGGLSSSGEGSEGQILSVAFPLVSLLRSILLLP